MIIGPGQVAYNRDEFFEDDDIDDMVRGSAGVFKDVRTYMM